MSLDKFFSKVLLVTIPLYFSQGWLFSSGSYFSQLLVAIWLLVNIFYLVAFCIKGKRSTISNLFVLFWVTNLIYWLFSPKIVFGIEGIFKTFGDFKNITLVTLSYFPFVYFQRKHIINENYLRHFFILYLIAAIVAFILKRDATYSEYGINLTNNAAYYFVVLLPFLGAFWRKKRFWIYFLIIIVFLLLSAKRGAIFCGVVTYIVYFVLSSKEKRCNILYRITSVLLVSAIMAVLVNYLYSSSDLLQDRFAATLDGDSSGRDLIYAELWNTFLQSSIIHQIFGNGMTQTVNITGGYAHNDWLELLINEGLFGAAIYAALFVSCMYYYIRNRILMDFSTRYILVTALLCFFLRSVFSMGYLAPESAIFSMAMACGYARCK